MADFDFDTVEGFGESSQGSGGFENAANWFGALTSLALIIGLAVWGYKLVLRDVTGVPVVRALEGPMRVAPEDPGGVASNYQGLAVNRIPAKGEAEPPAERLVLAPQPVRLSEEDVPVVPVEEVAGPPAAPRVEAVAEPRPAPDPAPVEEPAPVMDNAVASALTEAMAEPEPAADGIIPVEVAGVSRSLRPEPRPQGDFAVSGAGWGLDVAPADVPAGTRLVQLGAFETPAIARQEWDRIVTRFDNVFAGKNRVIEETTSGGKTFFRLRAMGFDDLDDARRFCSTLMAEKAACIPVLTR